MSNVLYLYIVTESEAYEAGRPNRGPQRGINGLLTNESLLTPVTGRYSSPSPTLLTVTHKKPPEWAGMQGTYIR